MPRPVKNLEPVVIEAARSISSNSLSLTSPPSSTTDNVWGVPIHHANSPTINQLTAWGLQWDSIDEQVYDKDEMNLSMSVRRPRRDETPDNDASIIGFMDQAMKEDGFIPLNEPINQSHDTNNGRETRANEPTPPFTTITTVPAPNRSAPNTNQTTEFVCPCCGIGTPGGIAYHEHVTQCYIGRFMESVKATTPMPNNEAQTPSSDQPVNQPQQAQNSIHTLRSAVSNLDLHERIGLMEAFFRLSRTAGSTNQTSQQPVNQAATGQDTRQVNQSIGDEAVISLLFSPTDDKKTEKPVEQPVNQPVKQLNPPVTTSYNPTIHHPSLNQPRTPARSPSASPSFNHSVSQRNCLTPAMSPLLGQPTNQHTCLTPALHRWELDGKEDEYLHGFSLVDHDQSANQTAPLTPPSAFKRARALSQPHVGYADPSGHHPLTLSPHMRSYSPVRVHIQPPANNQSIGSWNLNQNLTVNSLSARRHSINNPSIKHSINYPGISAVDGLTFNAGVVNSPSSTQSSPIHPTIHQSINQHRLHQYLPVQPKHKRGNQTDLTRQSA